jgi:hypothetical protein
MTLLRASHIQLRNPRQVTRSRFAQSRKQLPTCALLACLSALLGTLALVTLSVLCTGVATAAGCPNEAVRLETGSTRLPDCRAYEMVSPPYKGGFGATKIEAVALNGESVAYFSPGVFAGAPSGLSGGLDNAPAYLARREAGRGWTTLPFMPPATLLPAVQSRDVSPTLESTLAFGFPAPNAEHGFALSQVGNLMLHPSATPDVSEDWELMAPPLETVNEFRMRLGYMGADQGFCHVFFQDTGAHDLPVGQGAVNPLYDVGRGCDGEPPGIRLASANNEGGPVSKECGALVSGNNGDQFNAIASNGQELFFTTCIANDNTHHQLFLRLAGQHTVEVSRPLSEVCHEEIPCPKAAERASADFAGASGDGSRVYFTTSAPLTGSTQDSSTNLYLASIGCPAGEPACSVTARTVTSLTQVSHDPNLGGSAGVQGVVRIAPDGSRVYFVASGDLLGSAERQALEAEGRPTPQPGADNLYVYDGAAGSGTLAFIARLCTGREASGATVDTQCPGARTDAGLWTTANSESQTAGRDGGFLLFATHAQLTADDVDTAQDLYRYDAATGVLDRVSVGEAGHDRNGNSDSFDASILPGHTGGSVRDQYELNNRAISEDGSRIVFTTAEALSPAATNGLTDVYEWQERPGGGGGEVSLISSGSAETPTTDVTISPDGNDIFFITTQGLLPQDRDGSNDIYDARAGGGFLRAAAGAAECEAEACPGPLSLPAPVLVPASASQSSGGNFASPSQLPAPGPAPKANAKHKAHKRAKRKAKRARARSNAMHERSGGRTNQARRQL